MTVDATFQEKLRALVDAQLSAIDAKREKLVRAWIAETGLRPSESMLVEQRMNDGRTRVWVQRREVP